ncbi:FAD-dependent oxidoreductase [Agromyces sp. SYSU T00194]|uniref:FAD-dependent oxidoreductase n=1 Tax=Agromyces chitinivorans TaxID=3158560 RepID=UPI003395E8A2
MRELTTDVLIVGGGLGGVAAAVAVTRLGGRAVLTEESPWLGGQLTSQAVPPDEHPWVEESGVTARYRELRERIRDYYRRNYRLRPEVAAEPHLNPGDGWVSRLCVEPQPALAAIDEMLAAARADGRLTVLTGCTPTSVRTEGDRIAAVGFSIADAELWCSARYVLDATETGEVVELADVESVIGSESRDETGELHARAGAAEPRDQQALSWCFALEYRPDEPVEPIERPAEYDFWREYRAEFWPGSLLSWTDVDPRTGIARTRSLFAESREQSRDLWRFRRISAAANFAQPHPGGDISVVNWPQIDYWLGPIVGVDADERDRHLAGARSLSRSVLHWLQVEAPRPDGGEGYPGLRPRAGVLGTADGLALRPYIRESRRIRALTTVVEQHVGIEARRDAGLPEGSEVFADSVGVGAYRIDLHPSVGGAEGPRGYVDVASYPFQIPLGSLIPERVRNLIAAGKCIGTTHVTNGCYRLHPVEWNIGEAAGALAVHCLRTRADPHAVWEHERSRDDFQRVLAEDLGIQLAWPEEIRTSERLNQRGGKH